MRPRNVSDLELAGDDRPIAEHAAEQALLDLHRPHPSEPNRRGATSDRTVHDEELLARQDDASSIPPPDGTQDDECADGQQGRSEDRRRPAGDEREQARAGQRERAQERSDEDDAVPPLVEADLFVRRGNHAGLQDSPRRAELLSDG